MIDVVLDTNVLVAAFRSSKGASYQLLQLLESRTWRPVVSPALALEYEAVLKRGASEGDLYFRWRPALRDPDDDRILEVAVRTKAPIVTFNTRDFAGSERYGVSVMRPIELLHLIERP